MYTLWTCVYLLAHASFEKLFQPLRIMVYFLDSAQLAKLAFFNIVSQESPYFCIAFHNF